MIRAGFIEFRVSSPWVVLGLEQSDRHRSAVLAVVQQTRRSTKLQQSTFSQTGLGLGTILTSVIFLTTILALVVYLTVTKRDLIAVSSAEAQLDGQEVDGEPRVLVVTNKTDATAAVIEAVRVRAIAGPARFFVLVPNPNHLAFDRNSTDTSLGERVLKRALPLLEEPAGTGVEGRVATSPNAYDDIVEG